MAIDRRWCYVCTRRSFLYFEKAALQSCYLAPIRLRRKCDALFCSAEKCRVKKGRGTGDELPTTDNQQQATDLSPDLSAFAAIGADVYLGTAF